MFNLLIKKIEVYRMIGQKKEIGLGLIKLIIRILIFSLLGLLFNKIISSNKLSLICKIILLCIFLLSIPHFTFDLTIFIL